MKKILLIISVLFFFQNLMAEIIVFKDCGSEQYKYEKNDYTIDLKKEMMTREFIYSEESYKKLRLNDIGVSPWWLVPVWILNQLPEPLEGSPQLGIYILLGIIPLLIWELFIVFKPGKALREARRQQE